MKVRYFVGFRVSCELRGIVQRLKQEDFEEIEANETLYLGTFLEKESPEVEDVKKGFIQMERRLAPYRLELPRRLSTLKLIAQLFIG